MVMIRYELRAVRLAKLKQMTTESNMVSNSSAYEVEMSEAKFPMSSEPEISMEQKWGEARPHLSVTSVLGWFVFIANCKLGILFVSWLFCLMLFETRCRRASGARKYDSEKTSYIKSRLPSKR